MQIIKNQFTPAHAINIVSFSDTTLPRAAHHAINMSRVRPFEI
jgi:hypothetical protein